MNLSALFTEIRQSIRALARRPAFAATVSLTLGLGIGATSTIYSVVDAVILRNLPYSRVERLVAVGTTLPDQEWREDANDIQQLDRTSIPNFLDWQAGSRSFERLAAIELASTLRTGEQGGELVRIGLVTEGFLELFGAHPILGRSFAEDDYSGKAGAVRMISYGTWVRRHGADPAVIENASTDDQAARIIGVLPPDFRPPDTLGQEEIEYWGPLNPDDRRYTSRGRRSVNIFGRLREGVTVQEARSELGAVQARVATEFPAGNVFPDGKRFGAGVNDLHAEVVGGTGKTIWVFFAASLLLLLIACLNSANLLLVRGLDRMAEIAVRKALGAGRGRLVSKLLVDSLLLALPAGIVGLILAYGGVEIFHRFAPRNLPRLEEVAVNARILAVCLSLTLGTGVLIGLFPALRLLRRDLASTVKACGSTLAESIRIRRIAVVVQLAVAFVLCVGASLLVHSYARLAIFDPGFQADELTPFYAMMPRTAPDTPLWQQWDDLRSRVESVPGLDGVAQSSNLPFQHPHWTPWMRLAGDPPNFRRTGVAASVISPTYFSVAGIPVENGRAFDERDTPDARRVAIVNRRFVRENIPAGAAVGMTFAMEGVPDADIEIVGVVGDTVQTSVEEGWRSAVYFPYTQADWPAPQMIVRSGRDLASLAADLRQSLSGFSPVAVRDLTSMNELIWRAHTSPRFIALLIASLGAVAIMLSAVGLYATMAHSVGRRSRELGIRMAIGANRWQVFGMVLREGLVITAMGVGIGLAGSLVATRFLGTLLYGIGAYDVLTFSAATLTLSIAVVLSMLRPAQRATRINLSETLRTS